MLKIISFCIFTFVKPLRFIKGSNHRNLDWSTLLLSKLTHGILLWLEMCMFSCCIKTRQILFMILSFDEILCDYMCCLVTFAKNICRLFLNNFYTKYIICYGAFKWKNKQLYLPLLVGLYVIEWPLRPHHIVPVHI